MDRKFELRLTDPPIEEVPEVDEELEDAEVPTAAEELFEEDDEDEADEEEAEQRDPRLRFWPGLWWCLRCAPGDRRVRPTPECRTGDEANALAVARTVAMRREVDRMVLELIN